MPAYESSNNVPLASLAPAKPSNRVAVSPFDAPIAMTWHAIGGPCRRVPASNMAMGRRLSITARNRIEQTPNAIAEQLRAPTETATMLRTASKATVNRWQTGCGRLA